jgi:AraC-like DNA-binding protein
MRRFWVIRPIAIAAIRAILLNSWNEGRSACRSEIGAGEKIVYIERAKTLLENPAVSVTEIAMALGFADPTSFASAFRRSVGTTPTKYRRGIR